MTIQRLPRVDRCIAESLLKDQGCEPKELKDGIPGQWWCASSGGPKFFLQWCKDDPLRVDMQHLTIILEDLARHRPVVKH